MARLIWKLITRLRWALDAQRRGFEEVPAFDWSAAVVMPVYTMPLGYVKAAVRSVLRQLPPGGQLVLVDDGCPPGRLKSWLGSVGDPRVTLVVREANGHICRATNDGLAAVTTDWVAFVDCDDVLEPHALATVGRAAARRPEVAVWYTDERQTTAAGWPAKAAFHKPEFGPETLLSLMVCGHLTVVKTRWLKQVGGLRLGTEGAQDHDLLLRLDEAGAVFGHVPQVLYRWRARKGSTARRPGDKNWALDAGLRVRHDALARRGGGEVAPIDECHQAVALYPVPPATRVALIVPTKNHPEILGRFVASLAAIDPGCPFHLVVVDNGSCADHRAENQRVAASVGGQMVDCPGPFNFSHLCNRGKAAHRAEVYLFANDDLEARQPGWLARLVGQARQPGVGAVGAKLLYPGTQTIQHAGVLLLEQGPAHALHGRPDLREFQFGFTKLAWNVSAVTGACLAISNEALNEVSGWDEGFPVAYNDVDLCLRLGRVGRRTVVRNDVMLWHHESASRGLDRASDEKRQRQAADLQRLLDRHPQACGPDPFYPAAFDQRRSDFAPRGLP